MPESESEIGFAQLGLGSVLKQNQLAVPPNQREYSWEKKEVRTLFQDFTREIQLRDRKYFLGTIVTIPRAGGTLEVVDGQQRLATTAILLFAIQNYLRATEPELASSINDEFLSKFVRETRSREPRLKLNLLDNEFFRSKLEGQNPTPSKRSHCLIQEAFDEADQHVLNVVNGLDPRDHGDELNRWVSFIEQRAVVILLRVPDATNAYRMFETLNDRGKRVSQSDLVKNYLFGEAASRINEVQAKWSFMRGTLESLGEDDVTIDFLRHAITLMSGFAREADVYERVHSTIIGEQPAVRFAGQLEALANSFVAIQSPDHEKWNSFGDRSRKAIAVLNLLDIKVLRPVVLAISEKFSVREADRSLTFLVSLAVRLMIGNKTRTGTVEEGLAAAGHRIYHAQITSLDQLKTELTNIIPSDVQFRAAFSTATSSNRKLARYYLRSLELQRTADDQPWHIPNDDPSSINLEHILPDRPEGNWPQFDDETAKLYRNRIGNFALLKASENSHLRSAGFATKKQTYIASPYLTTSEIGNYADWAPSEIDRRQSALADLAVKAWPI